jgi:single-strand DNA-binding protein
MNHVMLTGNSGADAEIKQTQTGFSICNLSIAVSRKVKDEFKSSWFRVVLLGQLAERMGPLIKKGNRLMVDGELQANEWTDKEGNKQSRTEILAREVQIIQRPPKHDEAPATEWGESDIPF